MNFREIYRFEVAYQMRRAWPWLIIVVLMFLVFLFAQRLYSRSALHRVLYQLAVYGSHGHRIR